MTAAHDPRFRAVRSRDPRFDGRFFTGVRTTGIYCRPVCPARTPLPRNVTFYATAAAAEADGFRACRRCRPEAAPGSPAWDGTRASASRALRLIEDGALDRGGVDALAERLGMGARHLRRLVLKHLGATPLALATTRRLHFARRLLHETALPVEQVASASGFGSARRFREAFREAFDAAPSSCRRASVRDASLTLALHWRPPMEGGALLAFLAARAIPGVESVQGATWSTSARFGADRGVVAATIDEPARCVRVSVSASLAPHLLEITTRVRRLFELDADPLAIASVLSHDALLRPLVRRRPGLRSPGAFDPFTAAVRIVVGQQVSVAAATTIAGRIASEFGEPFEDRVIFPPAERLCEAPVERCGMPSRRGETIRGLARLAAGGGLAPRADLEATLQALRDVPGIGPWTASAIAMRALSEPDAFPSGDLLLARALGGPSKAEARSQEWRPFRAHAAMHLWTGAAT